MQRTAPYKNRSTLQDTSWSPPGNFKEGICVVSLHNVGLSPQQYLYPPCFQTKVLYAFIPLTMCNTYPPHHNLSCYNDQINCTRWDWAQNVAKVVMNRKSIFKICILFCSSPSMSKNFTINLRRKTGLSFYFLQWGLIDATTCENGDYDELIKKKRRGKVNNIATPDES